MKIRRAVSPVLATVITIVITLVAAIAIAGFVFGLFGTFASNPNANCPAGQTCTETVGAATSCSTWGVPGEVVCGSPSALHSLYTLTQKTSTTPVYVVSESKPTVAWDNLTSRGAMQFHVQGLNGSLLYASIQEKTVQYFVVWSNGTSRYVGGETFVRATLIGTLSPAPGSSEWPGLLQGKLTVLDVNSGDPHDPNPWSSTISFSGFYAGRPSSFVIQADSNTVNQDLLNAIIAAILSP